MISFQTNIPSLTSQNNLRINNEFQGRTITRLTSGYRINSSADDAAGLAIANGYRSFVAEVTQGVRNANDGLSTLQIIDGGLNNVSRILDRLKSLATQAASGTFQGDRNTLNEEYQSLLSEIDTQANKIGLGTGTYGARFNADISVYVGGGGTQGNDSKVAIDLSGAANIVTAEGLGLELTSVSGATKTKIGGSVDLRLGQFLTSTTATATTQTFSFNITTADGVNTSLSVTISGGTPAGITGEEAVQNLNSALSPYGIQASINSEDGRLELSGTTAFVVNSTAAATAPIASTVTNIDNAGLYTVTGSIDPTTAAANGNITFFKDGQQKVVAITTGDDISTILSNLNNATSGSAALGIYAMVNSSGFLVFQSEDVFSYSADDDLLAATATAGTAVSPDAPASVTQEAEAALARIDEAVLALGLVQGIVGASQNRLGYAIDLAESQISSYSAAEARIRDADIATEAANLTKAQVLQQSSIAALAQANAVPQALLALLRG